MYISRSIRFIRLEETLLLEDDLLSYLYVHLYLSGDNYYGENPTVYRSLASYNNLFQSVFHEKSSSGYETLFIRPVQSYIKVTLMFNIYTKPPECVDIICLTSSGFHS